MASFPANFIWGAAASAYQTEGAWDQDGKGPSIWDVFCREKGRTWSGHTGETACDFYHRFADDVRLMKEIGLRAYRFSVSWPRVLPEGTGKVNEKGLAFYDKLVDALLAAGIEPYLTLYHWDFPLSLHHRGNWLNAESPKWFADYTRVVVDRLSDRVKTWITLNEPQVHVGCAFKRAWHAPGWDVPMPELFRITHHHLLAHGRAVQIIREHAKLKPTISIASAGLNFCPATDSPADVEATRQKLFGMRGQNMWNTAWITDPIVLGRYPQEGYEIYGDVIPRFDPADLKVISEPLDFFGINLYHGSPVTMGADGQPVVADFPVGQAFTPMDWPITPRALYWSAKLVAERYKVPLFVTENGMSSPDSVSLDGKVHDPSRIDYLHRYLLELKKAIDEGVDVRGYLQWSLMDNFEWHMGYRQRFGLIFIDYPTQRRVLKDSAHWYKNVIASNGACLS
ncbi:MAG: beta-glucosidase [Phycisphaeraceae bacterium]|nr:beta-glucosidase [Phycisphaeraceae bacterium]